MVLIFEPTQRLILGAGWACRMSGEDAITPDSNETVSFDGGWLEFDAK